MTMIAMKLTSFIDNQEREQKLSLRTMREGG